MARRPRPPAGGGGAAAGRAGFLAAAESWLAAASQHAALCSLHCGILKKSKNLHVRFCYLQSIDFFRDWKSAFRFA
eukprot:COSAG01_NODE_1478_length_10164_cov_66.361550_6_plen_76_part_00